MMLYRGKMVPIVKGIEENDLSNMSSFLICQFQHNLFGVPASKTLETLRATEEDLVEGDRSHHEGAYFPISGKLKDKNNTYLVFDPSLIKKSA